MTSRIVIGSADAKLLRQGGAWRGRCRAHRPLPERGARRVFVTSFTFQAPDFYERRGYREIFRWDGVPVDGHADVHFRKDL